MANGSGLPFKSQMIFWMLRERSKSLGKLPGSDLSKKKATYPSVVGLEESKRRARELVDLAVEALSPFGDGGGPPEGNRSFIVLQRDAIDHT